MTQKEPNRFQTKCFCGCDQNSPPIDAVDSDTATLLLKNQGWTCTGDISNREWCAPGHEQLSCTKLDNGPYLITIKCHCCGKETTQAVVHPEDMKDIFGKQGWVKDGDVFYAPGHWTRAVVDKKPPRTHVRCACGCGTLTTFPAQTIVADHLKTVGWEEHDLMWYAPLHYTFDNRITSMVAQVVNLTADYDRLHTELAAAYIQIEEQKETIGRQQQGMEKWQQGYDVDTQALKQRIDNQSITLGNYQQEIETLKGACDIHIQTIIAKEREIKDRCDQIATRDKMLINQSTTLGKLQQEMADLKDVNAALKEHNPQDQTKIIAQFGEILNLKETIEAMTVDTPVDEEMLAECKRLTDINTNLANKNYFLTAHKEELLRANNALGLQRQAMRTELEQYRKIISTQIPAPVIQFSENEIAGVVRDQQKIIEKQQNMIDTLKFRLEHATNRWEEEKKNQFP